jgi:hypothetical protein
MNTEPITEPTTEFAADTAPPEKVKLIRRTFLDATCDFLRYQVGIWVYRPETRPVYNEEGTRILAIEETGRDIRVFFLLGHSHAPGQALRMARLAHARYLASLQ